MLAQNGFDTRFRRAEDVELAYRLSQCGLRFLFNANAVGYHYADRPFASWLQTARDYGTNDVHLRRRRLGRPELLQLVGDEFRAATRSYSWPPVAASVVPAPSASPAAILESTASASDAVRADRLTRLSLSGLYNIGYYCGLADELGGREEFRQVVGRR